MAISLRQIFWLLTILVSLNVIVVSRRRKPVGEILWGQSCRNYKPGYFKYPDPVECYRKYSYGTVKDHVEDVGENEYKDKIYGGHASPLLSWPSYVRLIGENRYIRSFCGGTILTDRIILTAAHCFVGYNTEQISIILSIGYNEFNALGRLQLCTSPSYKSDDWKKGILEHDIAIIVLETRLPLTHANRIRFSPACLPTKRDHFPVNKVVGMGVFNEDNDSPPIPLELTVFREDQDRCYFRYKNQKYPQDLVSCFFSWHNQPGTTCIGDSGGPVYNAVGDQIGMIVAGTSGCNYNSTLDPFLAIDTCDKRRAILRLADVCFRDATENFNRPKHQFKLIHDVVLD